jgi:hypothetical protein
MLAGMRTRSVVLLAIVPFASLACSSSGHEKTSDVSEGLDVVVTLPSALGGETKVTHYAAHTKAATVFPMGLVPSAPP